MTERTEKQNGHARLIIDLALCDQCETCDVRCGYYDRRRDEDRGILALRERATFALVCRRCEIASCILACPFGAIERQDDQVLKRHNLRCVSCKLCAHACPFGTIYTDMLPFYESPCDGCISRDEGTPLCVSSCSRGALEYRAPNAGDPDEHVLDAHLAARAQRWVKQEAAP